MTDDTIQIASLWWAGELVWKRSHFIMFSRTWVKFRNKLVSSIDSWMHCLTLLILANIHSLATLINTSVQLHTANHMSATQECNHTTFIGLGKGIFYTSETKWNVWNEVFTRSSLDIETNSSSWNISPCKSIFWKPTLSITMWKMVDVSDF